MICSIHQPNYIPYIGLFHKILLSDIFIFYDNAQYTKGDFHNRNTIKWPNGPILLSLPVSVKMGQAINEVSFTYWSLDKHWKTIEQSYKKSKYYDQFSGQIKSIFDYTGTNLAAYNIRSIKILCELLWISTQLVVLSEMMPSMTSSSSEALADICALYWSDTYISWSWWRWYIDSSIFKKANIALKFQDFHHPTYVQLWGDFIPYMSIIDLIFNEWPESIGILKNSWGILDI